MRCEQHSKDSTWICLFCGRAFCADCAVQSSGSRRACSSACLDGLKTLDEAAIISATKGKRTLKANVTFCLFLGTLFVVIGLLLLLVSRSAWPFTAFLVVVGLAYMVGGLIYARALREQKTATGAAEGYIP